MSPSNAGTAKPVSLVFLLGLMTCATGLIICGVQGCTGSSSSPVSTSAGLPPVAAQPAVFPLVTSADHRYLQDQNGVPFPILGRTAWFITSLSEADYKLFIDDTVAKGFNAIEFHVVNHDPRGNNEPFGGNGAVPFTLRLDQSPWSGSISYQNGMEVPDFSQPNEPYWRFVDDLLTYAESKGVLCFLFPAYTGNQGTNQGWMQEMVVNGPSRMQSYGAFIANRYKTRRNIVWMLGGDHGTGLAGNDFAPDELAVEQALLAGMQSIPGQVSTHFSAEWANNSIYTDQTDPTLRLAGTLQGSYSNSGNLVQYTRDGYAYTPEMPTFLLEEPYDEEGPPPEGNGVNNTATQPVRRFQWWGWLSGIGGYIAGNGFVWPFNPGWEAHLDTQGARDMAQLNAFIRSIAWWSLIPSDLNGMQNLILAGNSIVSNGDYIAAAASKDGTLLVAYIPPDHSGPFTVDMTAMSGPTRARWFNPATGQYTPDSTALDHTHPHDFVVPPGGNGTGFNDWVLVLDRQ